MATISWVGGNGNNWDTAANWSPSTVPGSSDEAVIAASGNFTVAITNSISVGSIAINNGGASLSVSGSGVTVSVATTVTNVGTVLLQSGAAFSTGGDLTNSGSLYVNNAGSGGASLSVGGTLGNSNYVQIGNGSLATTVTAQNLSNTGRIDIDGGSTNQALLNVTGASAPSTWTGTLNIYGNGLLEFAGTGSIGSIAGGAQINLSGTHALVAAAGVGATSNTALSALASNAGQLTLESGAAVTTTSGLTNTGNLYVDVSNTSGGSSLNIGGTLTNSSVVQIGNGIGAGTLTVQGLSNTGQINLFGAGSTEALLNVTGASAPSTWTGTLNIHGNGLLEFAGTGSINSIAGGAQINLYGADALIAAGGLGTTSNTGLTTLSNNAGQFVLQDGAAVTTTNGLTNNNNLYVDTGGSGGSSLNIGGTLTNNSYMQIGNNNVAGTVTAESFVNVGRIDIDGGSTSQAWLNITQATAPSTWIGTLNVSGNGLLEFAGTNGINTIAGGAQIALFGPHAFVAAAGLGTTSNTALTALFSIAGDFELQGGASVALSDALAVTGSLNIDTRGNDSGSGLSVAGSLSNLNSVNIGTGGNDGGSTVSISGALNNSGTFNVAADRVTTPTTVSAATLDNTGTLNLSGTNGAEAIVDITAGIAPSVLASTITLNGDALLEYAGGNIDTIASDGQLNVEGAQSRVADSSDTTHNSALTGLTSIAGEFGVDSGASVAIANSLTVTGTLNVDCDLQVASNSTGAALTVAGDLINSGNVNVDNGAAAGGGTLAITGTLTNTNSLNIGTGYAGGDLSAPTTVSAAALNNDGTVTIWGNTSANTTNQATLDIASAAPGTFTGTINLVGDALLEYTGGSGITTIASGGQLNVEGAQSRVADPSDTTHNSALTGLTSIAGEFGVDSGASVAIANSLTVTGTLNVDSQVASNSTGAALTVAGDLINSGNVNVDNGAGAGGGMLAITGTLTNTNALTIGTGYGAGPVASTLVSAAGLSNSGTLDLIGNTTANTTNQATLDIGSSAPGTLGGTINLSGDSLLEFASGSFTSIAAGSDLTVTGSKAFVADSSDTTHNSALSGLQSIAGALVLQSGVTVGLDGLLGISGSASLKGSTLNVAGPVTLTGNSASLTFDASSTLDVTGGNNFTQDAGSTTVAGTLDASVVDAAGGSMDFTNAVTTDAFEIGGGAVLEFDRTVGSGVMISFTDASGTLQLNDPGGFAGTISGAQVGDVIHLIGASATGLNFASGTLTVSGSGGTLASLNFSGSYTNSDFSFSSDGSGGTYIVVTQGTANASVWTNLSGGSWTTAADWSNGAPTATTNALLNVPGSYTVTLASSVSANSVTLRDTNGTLEIDAGGSLAVGSVANYGTVNLIGNPATSGGAEMSVGGNFDNAGTLGVDDYDFFFSSGGSVLTVAGTLTNTGSIYVGNSFQQSH